MQRHENATLPYYQCLCSGLVSDSFSYRRYKYYFCKRAADLEKEVSGWLMRMINWNDRVRFRMEFFAVFQYSLFCL